MHWCWLRLIASYGVCTPRLSHGFIVVCKLCDALLNLRCLPDLGADRISYNGVSFHLVKKVGSAELRLSRPFMGSRIADHVNWDAIRSGKMIWSHPKSISSGKCQSNGRVTTLNWSWLTRPVAVCRLRVVSSNGYILKKSNLHHRLWRDRRTDSWGWIPFLLDVVE